MSDCSTAFSIAPSIPTSKENGRAERPHTEDDSTHESNRRASVWRRANRISEPRTKRLLASDEAWETSDQTTVPTFPQICFVWRRFRAPSRSRLAHTSAFVVFQEHTLPMRHDDLSSEQQVCLAAIPNRRMAPSGAHQLCLPSRSTSKKARAQ